MPKQEQTPRRFLCDNKPHIGPVSEQHVDERRRRRTLAPKAKAGHQQQQNESWCQPPPLSLYQGGFHLQHCTVQQWMPGASMQFFFTNCGQPRRHLCQAFVYEIAADNKKDERKVIVRESNVCKPVCSRTEDRG